MINPLHSRRMRSPFMSLAERFALVLPGSHILTISLLHWYAITVRERAYWKELWIHSKIHSTRKIIWYCESGGHQPNDVTYQFSKERFIGRKIAIWMSQQEVFERIKKTWSEVHLTWWCYSQTKSFLKDKQQA